MSRCLTVDQIRLEEGGSHDDGSEHQWEPTESLSGLIEKCTFCGLERPYGEDAEDVNTIIKQALPRFACYALQ